MEKPYEIIIIGGGLGGLACGTLLAKNGRKPLVVEMNEEIGGRAQGNSEDGFLYDYFPIGLTPVRGHRLELLATRLGLPEDHFKIKGPQNMSGNRVRMSMCIGSLFAWSFWILVHNCITTLYDCPLHLIHAIMDSAYKSHRQTRNASI